MNWLNFFVVGGIKICWCENIAICTVSTINHVRVKLSLCVPWGHIGRVEL